MPGLLTSSLTLIIQQLQYISLLGNIDVKWPVGFRDSLNIVQLTNLEVEDLVQSTEGPVIDFRMFFILFAVVLPIAITVLVMLLFVPLLKVLVYAVLCGGIVITFAGLLGTYLPSAGLDTAATGQVYLVIGLVLVGAAIVIFIIMRLVKSDPMTFEQEKEYYQKFHRQRAFRQFVVALFLILVSVTLLGFLDFKIDALDNQQNSTAGLIYMASWVALVIGIFCMLYFLINLAKAGRNAVFNFTTWLKDNGLMVLLLLITSSVIPSITYCVTMTLCAKYECPEGTRFNPFGSRPIGSWDTSASRYCDPCIFLNPSCMGPGSWQNVSDLCKAQSSLRNWRNPDIPCDDEAHSFFLFAAVVVLLVYIFAIPSLYFKIITYLTNTIASLEYSGKELDDWRTQWKTLITLMRPTAATLYEPYWFEQRYYVLVGLLQRVLVMTALLVIVPFYQDAAIPIILVIHALTFAAVVKFNPYNERVQFGLAAGLAFCNAANGAFAVFLWQQDEQYAKSITAIFYLANIIIPCVVAFLLKGETKAKGSRNRSATNPSHEPFDEEDVAKTKYIVMTTEKGTAQGLRNKINEVTGEQVIAKVFMIMGVFFFVALGSCILGSLRQADPEFRRASLSNAQNRKFVLAGYDNWQNMTSQCCCLRSTNPNELYNITERWVCHNGIVIEKSRQSRSLEDDGRPVRAVCAEESREAGCMIGMEGDRPLMQCGISTVASLIPAKMTEKALNYYW